MKFRVGNRVVFNCNWDRNVHLGGRGSNPESESEIPGGTTGVVVSASDRICNVQTPLGVVVAHVDYLDPVTKPRRRSC
jgi:hypothetical protein